MLESDLNSDPAELLRTELLFGSAAAAAGEDEDDEDEEEEDEEDGEVVGQAVEISNRNTSNPNK